MEVGLPGSINIAEPLSRDSNFKVLIQLELDLKNKMITEKLDEKYLSEFQSTYYFSWEKLNNTYGTIKDQDIKDASKTYFQQEKLFALNQNNIRSNNLKPNLTNHCTWGYDLCIAGVTAGAILCHAGCISGSAGFGTPACILLCGTMQVAAGAQCMKGYCDFSN